MNIEKIMKLANAQANARVEAAQASLSAINAQMAQLQATRQLAIDELTAANAAKAKLEGMLDEYCETQESPSEEQKTIEPAAELEVYAAIKNSIDTLEGWYVVAATSKAGAEVLLKEVAKNAGIGQLHVRLAEMYNGKLDKKVAAKAANNPGTVYMMRPYRKTLSEV